MRWAKAVVKHRVLILVLTAVLMVASVIGMARVRVNYDMLTYLPDDIDTVVGQDILQEDFHKGAFTFLILKDMPEKDVAALKHQVEQVPHVDTVLWYDSFADLSVPMDVLPDEVYDAFNTDNATMMAVFLDTSTSADETLEAVEQIRQISGKQCFVSGMTALVLDLRDLCEREEPLYVGLAVGLACAIMLLLLDGWLVPFVFLVSIGAMILLNMGTNIFLGEISYITKALSAVLQLAVTMDYSIFLWHSYNEQREKYPDDPHQAMAAAICQTFSSVIGSSVTTVAGFIALCFMSFTLGKDLGFVMAKGVVFGVIGCVTLLPSLILVLDKPLQKTRHRSLIPPLHRVAQGVTRVFPVFLAAFVLLLPPAWYGYQQTNNEVYYDMAKALPESMPYVKATQILQQDFGVASTHMVLVRAETPQKAVRTLCDRMKQVPGVEQVLGLDAVLGSRVPRDLLPDSVRQALMSDNWQLILIQSRYPVASDDVNHQLTQLETLIKQYDAKAMLIGEAPCMKDLIETTDHDFQVVNAISIVAIFVIILLVEKSLSLPVLLIALIELGIFINLGLPHYLGQRLSFINPICISTIQLGATVDYAILMTTRYKTERMAGQDKRTAVRTALTVSAPSILVSGAGLFASTFGVALYSDIEIIRSMCQLLARGAIISMLLVLLVLPAMFLLCDTLICHTTWHMGACVKKKRKEPEGK